MINLDDLPTNTLIESEERGWYLKDEKGCWAELYPHCIDCGEAVPGNVDESPAYATQPIGSAEEFLGLFKVVSYPLPEPIPCTVTEATIEVVTDTLEKKRRASE